MTTTAGDIWSGAPHTYSDTVKAVMRDTFFIYLEIQATASGRMSEAQL